MSTSWLWTAQFLARIDLRACRVSAGFFCSWRRLAFYPLWQIYDGPYGKDFTLLTGAHIVGAGHLSNLYDLATQTAFQTPLLGGYTFPGGLLPFNYPPYVAFFLLPLSYLSAPVAYYLWLGVTVAAQLGGVGCEHLARMGPEWRCYKAGNIRPAWISA